jgi:CO/xanthine dehydrogenase FAD-binding subunit
MLTEIQIPDAGPGAGSAYEKLAFRSAIDYPVVSAGAFVALDGDAVAQARLVIGAVARGPLTISAAETILKGRSADDEQAVEDAGTAAMSAAQAFIANNMAQPADYRIQMVSVTAKRALKRAIERAKACAGTMEAK